MNTPRTDSSYTGKWLVGDTNVEMIRADFARQLEHELNAALALLRELNDALVIPSWLQPRVDAVLDRAEEKT